MHFIFHTTHIAKGGPTPTLLQQDRHLLLHQYAKGSPFLVVVKFLITFNTALA